ncbi:LysR substrate-binding domain-containing protein [Mycetocola zhadangensis]|uniref:LysR family transcriptional regulator n=1 Tax=Mycetocola zhadangensis TaxID=1164595 RepID=A0A3L7J187_9MICO|nr:LysR substrate-binding domain-containing protein [Mycetocola zhadangensis]RLQ84237.1 LysR family transcriptional regulator [Mycetocola zhadangensis]GGE94829.1 LysR family transcriptional regulator [Mycetocola zhadangensis]
MYDPILLRTFLVVAETHSFTNAALRLGISQPTVSQQMSKLERAAGRMLLARDTREVRLTDNGDAMAGFARTILAAHAAAESYFNGSAMKGRLRFGAADDLAITQLPQMLRHFRQLYPEINLELTVNQSAPLRRRLEQGHLDLIFVKQSAGEATASTRVAKDTLVWMAQDTLTLAAGNPVPLIAYQAPSLSRKIAIDALEAAGRTWRITCNTRDVNGMLAAVRAGIGVAPFPHSLIPSDLVKVSNRFSLPELVDVDYVLMANPTAAKEPVQALMSAIMSRGVRREA